MKNIADKIILKWDNKAGKVKYIIGAVIVFVQVVVMAMAVNYLNKLSVLPERYYGMLIAGLIICLALTIGLNFIKYVHIPGKIFGLVVCAGLIYACVLQHQAIEMLNNITNGNYDVDMYRLVVLNESEIKEVTDISDKKIGIIDINDGKARENAIKLLKESANVKELTTKEYEDMSYLVDGLFEKEVDAILYLSELDGLITEILDYYADSVRVVSEFEVKTLIEERPTSTQGTTSNNNNNNNEETTTQPSEEPTTEKETETETKKPVNKYDPAKDPNAPAGGGYIGGDDTVDNSSKGPITDRCFNIYVSGIDRYGSLSGRSRSDVNILITVNPMTKEIVMTNTPRDYYVTIPGITTGDWRDKLTHAGLYGVWSSAAAIENIYGVQIDYYIRVNFTSFVNIVNAIGGVEVYSEYSFSSKGYSFDKGMNVIETGAEGLIFARERKSLPGGDRQRGKNQMALIEGMLNKIMSPAMIINFTDIVNSVSNCVQTNMTMDEITALAKMQIDDGASWTITRQAVTGKGAYRKNFSSRKHNAYVMLPDQATIDACKEKINSVLQ